MVRRDHPNKDTHTNPGEHIDPNSRHPALTGGSAAVEGQASKASRRTKPALSPTKSTASENPYDYFERAARLYGQHDARRIVANTPMGHGISRIPGAAT